MTESPSPAAGTTRSQIQSAPVVDLQLGRRVPALDSIRGIAILMVMVFHFNHHFNESIPDASKFSGIISKVLAHGELGVDLFFVLSGFLITGILYDSRDSRHYFRNFYIRRTLRIFPLYYGLLTCSFFVLLPLASHWHYTLYYADTAAYQGWLWLYGTNILQSWKNQWLLTGFNHFWSLAVEEHFYLIWPFVLYGFSRKFAFNTCLFFIVVALTSRVLLAWDGQEVAVYALTQCRFDALALGGLLAVMLRSPRGEERIRSRMKMAVSAGFLVLILLPIFNWKIVKVPEYVLAVRGTCYALLFGGLLFWTFSAKEGSGWARLGNLGLLRWFGQYSYALYVFHYPLLPFLASLFPPEKLVSIAGSALAGKLVFTLLATGVCCAASFASWHLFEKHFLKLKDRLAPR